MILPGSIVSYSWKNKDKTFSIYQKFMFSVGTGRYGFWTSGTLLPENHWVWLSTGKPIVHASWASPPNNKNKGCVAIDYIKTSKTMVWSDADCNDARHVICESTNV